MRSTISRGIVAAALVLTGACSSADSVAPAAAPASASLAASSSLTASGDAEGVTTLSRTIDQYFWLSCLNGGAGETVRITGELRYDMQRMQDSSGVYHLNIKANTSNLTAVGLTTGTFYRGLMTERVNSRAEQYYFNMDLRTADIIRFVAPGTGDSYSLMVGSHIIIDEGRYELWDQTWNEVCH